MRTVQRLEVRASLDDPEAAMSRARAEASTGDESWEQWAAEFERGEALVIRLDITVVAQDGNQEAIETANRGVFVEKDVHPPKLEQQIAEMATKDHEAIAEQLRERGHEIDMLELAEMYVHVELDPELREQLADEGAQRRSAQGGGPQAEHRLSEEDTPPRRVS